MPELESNNNSSPYLLSASRNDEVPELIPHSYEADSAYYNYTMLISETIYNYNLPAPGSINDYFMDDNIFTNNENLIIYVI